MVQVVWFKRDLRISDHRPLVEAAARGPVLPLYIAEPELWQQPDSDQRHWDFIASALADLQTALARLGTPLVIRTGAVVEVLEDLRQSIGIDGLWSHEETGNAWTFQRDLAVGAWSKSHGLPWTEIPQFGVVRRLKNRDGWAQRWDRLMTEPVTPVPILENGLENGLEGRDPGAIPDPKVLGVTGIDCPGRQLGGRDAALQALETFLTVRGRGYQKDMSSPLAGETGCSRLSPYLTYGVLSLREVNHRTLHQRHLVKGFTPEDQRGWRGALRSFHGRLHWHCHFIQKLEDSPDFEWRNVHSGYDGVRENDFDETLFQAWMTGETGFPFIDACMRSLRVTGWLNFRMRAMLMSFAAYQLWLHWREPGLHLARMFTDYEPGIHWNQVQMQSGTTGINVIRIYNPIKQSQDHDPDGIFIKRWIPELRRLPSTYIHEPWTMTPLEQADLGCVLGRDYPFPVVDHMARARQARATLYGQRKQAGFRDQAKAIVAKHGSRKAGVPEPHRREPHPNPKKRLKRTQKQSDGQTSFDFT